MKAEPTWHEIVDHRGRVQWLLRDPPGRWFDEPRFMLNTRQRGREKQPAVWQVHKRRITVSPSGWKKREWDYLTWTDTLDDAKNVANLLYASQQTE